MGEAATEALGADLREAIAPGDYESAAALLPRFAEAIQERAGREPACLPALEKSTADLLNWAAKTLAADRAQTLRRLELTRGAAELRRQLGEALPKPNINLLG